MNPQFHTRLVNDPFGDPGLYIGFKFERRALLFDLGDLTPLTPRQLLCLSHVFVSHTHMDHFIGFDRVLRVLLGREKRLHLFGPAGFIARVEAKLRAYSWNLVANFTTELALVVTEVNDESSGNRVEFRLKETFARRDLGPVEFADRVLVAEPAFRIRFAILDHDVPCLAFALEESRHVNVWRNEVAAMGLPVGPWLKELKDAVHRDAPDDMPMRIAWRAGGQAQEAVHPLGELKRRLLTIEAGQRIVYVTDCAPHERNFAKIVALARDADLFYCETVFLDTDAELAARRKHLTAERAGRLAREAGVQRLIPFHFSPRYADRGDALEDEAQAAFAGAALAPTGTG